MLLFLSTAHTPLASAVVDHPPPAARVGRQWRCRGAGAGDRRQPVAHRIDGTRRGGWRAHHERLLVGPHTERERRLAPDDPVDEEVAGLLGLAHGEVGRVVEGAVLGAGVQPGVSQGLLEADHAVAGGAHPQAEHLHHAVTRHGRYRRRGAGRAIELLQLGSRRVHRRGRRRCRPLTGHAPAGRGCGRRAGCGTGRPRIGGEPVGDHHGQQGDHCGSHQHDGDGVTPATNRLRRCCRLVLRHGCVLDPGSLSRTGRPATCMGGVARRSDQASRTGKHPSKAHP